MIDQKKLQEWVRVYLDHVQKISIDSHVNNEEGYKFQSVNNFQKYFDLENPDLAGMLEKAIPPNNLSIGSQYWPRKMLTIYAEQSPEETRNILRSLFNEEKDIYERITEAVENFNRINESMEEKYLNTFIGLRFLSLLLGFRFPEKYNPLKPSEWKFFARFLNPNFSIPNHTKAGEQYRFYEQYVEGLRNYISKREDVQKIKEALTRGLAFEDSESRWITQDIIYVTAIIIAEKESEKVKIVEIDSKKGNLSEETENEDDNTGFMPLEEHLEKYLMENWDIINFGEKLSIYRDGEGSPAQQYVTDVGIIDILAKDEQGNFVVIELKKAESRYHVVGQVLNYMTWVEENLISKNEKVRGMIIVGKAENTLKSALKQVSDKIVLREYSMKMTLRKVE